ncbi:hypothetical protein GJ697_26850 [Pseudoduganella sp. FT25W]|jgi:hypothetical protein|uniref:Uncharacterized protein n=1 Tax=Duganella alba TaxID=2666081 RepID=A0A6L5QP13_9BURK|nr:hypothetical protein [Duganella alba]MRX11449.1 hypothetical protein [Duganella alba]MRX19562.1 hypothetical protein [Duganella alba]
MNTPIMAPTADEFLARIMPPAGYENHLVVKRCGVLVWARREQLLANDEICFYDGDCREVFKPDDPRLQSLTR